MRLKGAIFDLDGIVVNTVPLHFKAWQKMFKEYQKEFDFEEYKNKVDGIPRLDGAMAILTHLPEDELDKAAARKQGYYLEFVEKEGVNVYQTTITLIKALRKERIRIAVISSSKSCHIMLERAGLIDLVDIEVNGNDITKGKPDPQIFLMALKRMKLKAEECIVFEDALLGVKAARNAGLVTVGVDRYRDPKRLREADLIVSDLAEVNLSQLQSLVLKEKK